MTVTNRIVQNLFLEIQQKNKYLIPLDPFKTIYMYNLDKGVITLFFVN